MENSVNTAVTVKFCDITTDMVKMTFNTFTMGMGIIAASVIPRYTVM